MNSSAPIFSEVQAYRELPPFKMLAGVGTIFGLFLITWVVILGRPLGALVMPPWLALAIGLPLVVLLPVAYSRMRMVTEVYPDRVFVNNGMTGRMVFPLADVVDVVLRADNILDDYNVRNVGAVYSTRIAYTVSSNKGVQLLLADGRQFLIGSKEPKALNEAVLSVWQKARPNSVAMETEVA